MFILFINIINKSHSMYILFNNYCKTKSIKDSLKTSRVTNLS